MHKKREQEEFKDMLRRIDNGGEWSCAEMKNREAYLMFSTVSSGMGATVCTAGRFLLVAPFTKLEDDAEEDEAESVAPAGRDRHTNLKLGLG